MPDIAMCRNEDCALSCNCWRFNAPPHPTRQSYGDFKPIELECGDYIAMDELIKK